MASALGLAPMLAVLLPAVASMALVAATVLLAAMVLAASRTFASLRSTSLWTSLWTFLRRVLLRGRWCGRCRLRGLRLRRGGLGWGVGGGRRRYLRVSRLTILVHRFSSPSPV
jgi:hypothetical protein